MSVPQAEPAATRSVAKSGWRRAVPAPGPARRAWLALAGRATRAAAADHRDAARATAVLFLARALDRALVLAARVVGVGLLVGARAPVAVRLGLGQVLLAQPLELAARGGALEFLPRARIDLGLLALNLDALLCGYHSAARGEQDRPGIGPEQNPQDPEHHSAAKREVHRPPPPSRTPLCRRPWSGSRAAPAQLRRRVLPSLGVHRRDRPASLKAAARRTRVRLARRRAAGAGRWALAREGV